jgi:hypothetical protein
MLLTIGAAPKEIARIVGTTSDKSNAAVASDIKFADDSHPANQGHAIAVRWCTGQADLIHVCMTAPSSTKQHPLPIRLPVKLLNVQIGMRSQVVWFTTCCWNNRYAMAFTKQAALVEAQECDLATIR